MKPIKKLKNFKFSRFLQDQVDDPLPVFLAKGMIRRFFTDDVGGSAAQMAYYILFSLFPFLIFVNALLSFFNIAQDDPVMLALQHMLPNEVYWMIQYYFIHINSIKSPMLLIFGLCMAYYSFSRCVKYLVFALRRAYRLPDDATLTMANAISLLYTFFTFLLVVVTFMLGTISSQVLSYVAAVFHLESAFLLVWDEIRFLSIGIICGLALALLYYLVPHRKMPFLTTLPGTALSLVCIFIATIGFSFYVDHIAAYSVIYGSLGTIIVLMLWLFMIGNIIIAGGEFNHLLLVWRRRRDLRQKTLPKAKKRRK